MHAFARAALSSAVLVFLPALVLAQGAFQEDRYLREYLWSDSVGQFIKFEPLRDESEGVRVIGLLIYKDEDRWMERPGCFPNLTVATEEKLVGTYSARSYRVWEEGRWSTPPVDVSILGTHIRLQPASRPVERLKSLELQISISDAVTYRKATSFFRKAAAGGGTDPECLRVLQQTESYVVSEIIVGRETYSYRRYTNQNLYPIQNAGPADFQEIREGQYQRTKPLVLAYRVLKPVLRREGSTLMVVDFRPHTLKARRGF